MQVDEMSLRPPPSNRLAAVLKVGNAINERIVQQILGILHMDKEVLFTVRGMLRTLQLCQVTQRMSGYLNCNDKDMWTTLYKEADARIGTLNSTQIIKARRVLLSLAQAKESSRSMDDRTAANFFKRQLIRHILYFAMFDGTAFGLPSDNVTFALLGFHSQLDKFFARANGSLAAITKTIEQDLKRVRQNFNFPLVPAEFFVAAMRLMVEVYDLKNATWAHPMARMRTSELEHHILSRAFY